MKKRSAGALAGLALLGLVGGADAALAVPQDQPAQPGGSGGTTLPDLSLSNVWTTSDCRIVSFTVRLTPARGPASPSGSETFTVRVKRGWDDHSADKKYLTVTLPRSGGSKTLKAAFLTFEPVEYIKVSADSKQVVAESDETNNHVYLITRRYPDLECRPMQKS